MKKRGNTNEQIAHNNQEAGQLLTALKELIKTKSLRKDGFEKLLEIDADTLSVKHQVFYYYIKGKYYVLEFKDSQNKDIELLQYANDCFSDMVSIAYQNDFSIKDAKNHFSRAYCKYLIGLHHASKEVKTKLFQKVEQIVDRNLSYDSKNASFLWLKAQLKLVA